MPNPATIPGSSTMLELQNVPTELILYAVHNWQLCQQYTTVRSCGNNTNPFLKGISVWLILKAQTTTGVIQNYRRQLPDLATQCKISQRTMDNRLSWLRKQGLIKIEGKNLFVDSYKSLRKFDIDIFETEQTIYYDTEGKTRLSDILTAIAIGKAKEKWMHMYSRKLTANPNTLAEVRNHLIAYGADQDQLDDIEYVRQQHLKLLIESYKTEESGQTSFALLHKYVDANPDLNARQDTLASKLGLAAAMSFCHIKFRLIKSRLISVAKDHVRSDYRARKDEKTFHHKWLSKDKQTIWFRPDQITVNFAAFFGKNPAF